MKKYFLILVFSLGLQQILTAQENNQDSIKWATPNVKYMPMGRGLDISYTRIFTSIIDSKAEVDRLQDNNANLNALENLEFDIKFPIFLKDRTQILGSFEYTFDFYRFDPEDVADYELYSRLNKRPLRSRKAKFYLMHSFDSKHYLNVRIAGALNGDVGESEQSLYEFTKFTVAMMYGWQKSPTNSYGVGLYAGYTLGRPTIYPVLEWNKSWNEHWGFESKLPAKFMLRYSPNKDMNVYGGYDVDGISYRLVSESEDSELLKEYEVRRSDLMLTLNLEKRVYDFIWVGIKGGINFNVRLDASDGNHIYQDKDLITSQIRPAPYVNLSIFVVPTDGLKKLVGLD
ncbi:DUF6268 family outer membrane beta-barrel protein [Chondrinema litorale]|uniref:DUF6268 family outer membrane beta-barrel protein n=1 Tax=Chondrinema litorale TaxID=2994555 RepID=UPI002543F590|nr:DUF6268 family outer membrane beta-barrel protein [Chondrinema litorale]UZR95014.1 DUF6268 family outer membrane beta-barrel protein [Chondrinema litorale]